MSKMPWELEPALAKDMIIEFAKFIAQVRGEVIDLHDDGLGDTKLALGMRCYECTRSQIILVSKSGTWLWLSIITENKRFTFAINGIPVRFVREDPEKLPMSKLTRSKEALTLLMDDLFESKTDKSEIIWFFVNDTHWKHVSDNMYFVGYDKTRKIVCKWEIPLEEHEILISEIDKDKKESKKIEKAPIKVKKPKSDVMSNDEE